MEKEKNNFSGNLAGRVNFDLYIFETDQEAQEFKDFVMGIDDANVFAFGYRRDGVSACLFAKGETLVQCRILEDINHFFAALEED